MKVGIVGMPNAGKSSLFNALTKAGADAANYPFTTIEPNVAIVPVRDERLDAVARVVGASAVVPDTIAFHDIAGLVRGAHEGEGLGNQFLANIRETDAIVHVVRCFDDDDVLHVMGSVDPVRDREVIELELALAGVGTVEKRLARVRRAAKTGDKEALAELPALQRAHEFLKEGRGLWEAKLAPEEEAALRALLRGAVQELEEQDRPGGQELKAEGQTPAVTSAARS